ncbi:Aerobic glycerol-3-phosphate dehydrogenase [compost metagenome]
MAREWSALSRQTTLERLGKESWDLLVIGGGITGAGIALEAALRGFKVALVERNDFASGTSSKSSKLLHGGLRYLEHMEFKLVREALTQRNKLFKHAPHLAKEIPFLFPIYRENGDSLGVMDVGLWLYDSFSSLSDFHRSRLHRRIKPQDARVQVPELREEGLKGALAYVDGLTEDARMVVETMKTAVRWGAAIANYTEVTSFQHGPDGKVSRVLVTDCLSGMEVAVHARRVINAAGPWVDRINRMDDPSSAPKLKPTKGIHIVTRQVTDRALVIKSRPEDGKRRWMFVIPYYGRSIIGTTDTARPDAQDDRYLDDDVYATPEEIRYVLEATNDAIPGANLTEADIIATFGGWRPLIAPPEDTSESDISREHEIFETPSGIIAIAGGKYTTFRSMAKQVVDFAAKTMREEGWIPDTKRRHSDDLPLEGGDLPVDSFEAYVDYSVRQHPNVEPSLITRLVERYGTNYRQVLALIESDRGLDREVSGLSPEVPLLRAEIAYMVRFEQAMALSDVLMRRTRLNLLDADQGLRAAEEIALTMSQTLQSLIGWDEAYRQLWANREIEAYRQEVRRGRETALDPLQS